MSIKLRPDEDLRVVDVATDVEGELGQAQDELFEVHLAVCVPVEDVDHSFHQWILKEKNRMILLNRNCESDVFL